MKWFITCLVIIFIGLAITISNCVSLTVIAINDSLDENHLANLLIIYNIE